MLVGLAVPTAPSSTSGSRCGCTGCGRPGCSTRSRRLDAAGLREGRTAAKALGYSQALAHLDGRMGAEEAVADTIAATRRFARRQE